MAACCTTRYKSRNCARCIARTVLQGPIFSEFDLAALASNLDRTVRQMMLAATTGDFLPEQSYNVSLDGDFSILVLEKALEVWGLQIISLNTRVAETAKECPITSSEASNGYGQWLSRAHPGEGQPWHHSDPYLQYRQPETLLDDEDEDLKAAIAANLIDSSREIKTEAGVVEKMKKIKTATKKKA